MHVPEGAMSFLAKQDEESVRHRCLHKWLCTSVQAENDDTQGKQVCQDGLVVVVEESFGRHVTWCAHLLAVVAEA